MFLLILLIHTHLIIHKMTENKRLSHPTLGFLIICVVALLTLPSCENMQKANAVISSAIDSLSQVNWADDAVPQLKDIAKGANPNMLNKNELLDVKTPDNLPSIIKEYSGFTLSFNARNHTPNWVAWELLASETEGGEKRSNKFWNDTSVEGCADPSDYKNSGYDKGHMCPAAENKTNAEMMTDCFAMTNMCPQAPALNQKAWATLEKKERLWAQRDSAIYIVAGPIYKDSDKNTIGEIGVRVPSAFFKVIIDPYSSSPKGIAFIYPNMTSPGNMQNYSTTIDEVEKITGYDFFHALPDDLEKTIESSASFKEWNTTK